MELIFDLLAEIIMEPIIEGYFLAMSYFFDSSKKLNEDMVKTIVVFESIALFTLFVVGGVMLLKTDGESLTGKVLFIASVAVSIAQILFGIILNRMKKKRAFTRKITNEEQLKDLISRMCNEDNCSEESISWKAYREAEMLSDTSFLPFLQNAVLENQKNTKRDKKTRRVIYFIIENIIKNSFDESACSFLIDRLNIETDKYNLEDILGLLGIGGYSVEY